MVTKEIIEGNKLIAEFFGYFDESYKWAKRMNVEYNHNEDIPMLAGLRYHASWDWLMPACRKWDMLDFENEDVRKEYESKCDMLDNMVTTYSIKYAFNQLVDCIQWYNSKNKQNGNR